MSKRLLTFVAIAFLGPSVLGGQAEINLIDMKKDSLVFERILDERLKLVFSNPFVVMAGSQASYIKGYGVVVTLHLRTDRFSLFANPFADLKDTSSKEEKVQVFRNLLRSRSQSPQGKTGEKVQKIQEILIECLSTNFHTFRQLGAQEKISISVHIEDRNELDPIKRHRILVVTTTKDNGDLLAMRQITADEFRERLHFLDY